MDIQTEDMDDGTCGVAYCPTEPGTYVVSIRFAEEHVPGKLNTLVEFSHRACILDPSRSLPTL